MILASLFALIALALLALDIDLVVICVRYYMGLSGISSLYSQKFFILSFSIVSLLCATFVTLFVETILYKKPKED